jgi:NitT/TauT family transport system permease protein
MYAIGLIANYLLPTPAQVLATMGELSGELFSAFISTSRAAATGFFGSFVFGLTLALILSSSRWLKSAILPFATFFQTVPIVAIAPLLVIWFGFGSPTVVAAAFIVSFFPMLANCLMGFSIKNFELEEMLQSLGANPSQRFVYLQIPLAMPSILSGLKISAGLSVVGALVGEFVAGGGLGGMIDSARTQQRVDLVFASLIISSLLGLFFVSLVDLLNYFLLSWRPFYQGIKYEKS